MTLYRHALAVQRRLIDHYIPEITSITHEGRLVEAPQPVSWYPLDLAWYMTTPKNVIRRFPPFASFQKFLVAENDVGNITRQEVVSMIPPLVMDIKPGMTVLDMCAAPGSKSAQLIELLTSGEEERVQTVAKHLANGLDRPESDDYDDDGRSTGLLIANDIDYKRSHMLVHQMKRLSSANLIVTNHDATVYPSIKLSSKPSPDGKPSSNRYLKFDRILADVPCSGDGTPRKNLEIWKKWSPGNALGLHSQQVRILVRALQMLKLGGRVVYSTCSMNPVEDEAVVATAIQQCGGLTHVTLVESQDYLPGLKRSSGLQDWKVMDKTGRIWDNYQDILDQKEIHGEDGLGRLQETMFRPNTDIPLDRCMRLYAHQQDTGAFFVAILQKNSEIKVHSEPKPVVEEPVAMQVADSNGTTEDVAETNDEVEKLDSATDSVAESSPFKKIKRDNMEEPQAEIQPNEREGEDGHSNEVTEVNGSHVDVSLGQDLNRTPAVGANTHPLPQASHPLKRSQPSQPFEEPFKYLEPDISELDQIRQFYEVATCFPRDRFMVRNALGTPAKNIYYTSALAKEILQENEGRGMKFVHSGIKIFVKQDAPRPEVCPWRIQTDGLPVVEPWVSSSRVVKLTSRATLRKLLIEMFPKFAGEEYLNLGEIGERVRDIAMGCCVLVVEPTEDPDGISERMVFPLWKSLQSVNLMLPKEDRKALLLRMFNEDSPLINLQQSTKNVGQKQEKKVEQTETPESPTREPTRRNSSSDDGHIGEK